MEKYFESLRKYGEAFLKEKNVPVNKRRPKINQDAKVCYICEKRILQNLT